MSGEDETPQNDDELDLTTDDAEQASTVTVDDMYSQYFLEYASYVILERAVPHINDGLKPVQRRILHAMFEMEDGRYNKVANIVGDTMKYHPHGDASIGDAVVQLGQKDLLIDTQGNWGNTLTGDPSAAPRYIEARLTKFALAIAFSPKITDWTVSYDGRRREPVTEPVKFPLLLAQGVEGIAVGLACKILPHNFNEIIDGCIAVLRKNPFELLPDFPTGGIMDATNYNDGVRGGKIRVRAQIVVDKAKLLRIREIPFSTTTGSLIDSIVSANEKGKIKISKIEDNTSASADILVHLPAGVDAETMRDALFAFTDCEVSISPNSGVIKDGKPRFLGVTEILRSNAEQTRDLLGQELEIKLKELQEKWHFSSLEKIFIENRIYRDIEECETWEAVLTAIDEGLKPHIKGLLRDVTEDDLVRLTEIKIKRISKFDSFKADEILRGLEADIEETEKNIRNLTRFTIRWFEKLKKDFGKGRDRKTVIDTDGFGKIDRAQVVVATETLYVDRKAGFAGYGLKKEESIEKCSTIDDVVCITKDGVMQVQKISAKSFFGKNIIHCAVFRKEEADSKVYEIIYRDGRDGAIFAKRFKIGGTTRDKEYNLTQGKSGTRIFHFAVHDSEKDSDDNMVRIHMKSGLGLRNLQRDFLFGELAIKGRGSRGNIVTKHPVDRIVRAPKEAQE